MTLLLPALAFAFVAMLVTAGALALAPGNAAVIRRRLGELTGKPIKTGSETLSYDRVVETLKKVGNAIPKSPSEMSKLQLRQQFAGYKLPAALRITVGDAEACARVAEAVGRFMRVRA